MPDQPSRTLPSRRSFLLTLGGIGLAAASAAAVSARLAHPRSSVPDGLQLAQQTGRALGADICMIALHPDAAVADRALAAAFAELARVERTMSLYLPESELCRLNRDGILAHADPYLIAVLQQSLAVAEESGGAFDPTVQPLWTLYAAAAKSKRLPADSDIAAARLRVDYRAIQITGHTIRLRPGTALTLNGIAQGFAADRAMEALKSHGIAHALVNTGEIASLGRKADRSAWTVGIQHPRLADAYLGAATLSGRCISTSGDYETAFSSDKAYNHIFDPASGRSPQAFSSVTVVADTATVADALSTAIFVLGPDKGLALAGAHGAEVLLVTRAGRQRATANFPLNA